MDTAEQQMEGAPPTPPVVVVTDYKKPLIAKGHKVRKAARDKGQGWHNANRFLMSNSHRRKKKKHQKLVPKISEKSRDIKKGQSYRDKMEVKMKAALKKGRK
jgi:DNA/RNA endonuclease G (NUC1)